MFLCHINDLPDTVKSQVRLFADDCLLYRQIKSQTDHTTLQNDLIELEKNKKNGQPNGACVSMPKNVIFYLSDKNHHGSIS